MRFRTEILATGKTAAGVEVPAAIVERLGSKHPKVRATINGYTYRSSVASMGGRFLLGVNSKVRKKGGCQRATRSMSTSSSIPRLARLSFRPTSPERCAAIRVRSASSRAFPTPSSDGSWRGSRPQEGLRLELAGSTPPWSDSAKAEASAHPGGACTGLLPGRLLIEVSSPAARRLRRGALEAGDPRRGERPGRSRRPPR
jgi:hypothetical protein